MGQYSVDETWTGLLLPGDSLIYQFNIQYIPPTIPYEFCVRLQVKDDANPFNDKLCKLAQPVSAEEIDQPGFYLGSCIPNPAADKVMIPYSIPENGTIHFTVYGLTGKILYKESIGSVTRGTHKYYPDISFFENGTYFICMKFNGISVVRKMVILR